MLVDHAWMFVKRLLGYFGDTFLKIIAVFKTVYVDLHVIYLLVFTFMLNIV